MRFHRQWPTGSCPNIDFLLEVLRVLQPQQMVNLAPLFYRISKEAKRFLEILWDCGIVQPSWAVWKRVQVPFLIFWIFLGFFKGQLRNCGTFSKWFDEFKFLVGTFWGYFQVIWGIVEPLASVLISLSTLCGFFEGFLRLFEELWNLFQVVCRFQVPCWDVLRFFKILLHCLGSFEELWNLLQVFWWVQVTCVDFLGIFWGFLRNCGTFSNVLKSWKVFLEVL